LIGAAIYGASGYGGVELLRLLLAHPDVEVRQATSREPGRRIDEVHPGLRGLTDLSLTESRPSALDAELDAVFLALPHGESAQVAEGIAARCPQARLFDLAQDFRTGHEPSGWVYGQPELFREKIRNARKVACPGCFATAILLGTGPAFALGMLPGKVIVDAKTGSSGSGASTQAGTHHPTRVATHKAYKVFEHQHETEVKAAWAAALPHGSPLPPLAFVPQSTPLVRGIYACCYLVYDDEPDDAESAYRRFYSGSPFIRVIEEPPNVAHVRGTNNAELCVRRTEDVLLVIVAIDNLVRGAAGQAVQCMNLAFGLPEERGLRLAALVP
jgi:N-acetyl-gamma-glutamyl-phosphate reductase